MFIISMETPANALYRGSERVFHKDLNNFTLFVFKLGFVRLSGMLQIGGGFLPCCNPCSYFNMQIVCVYVFPVVLGTKAPVLYKRLQANLRFIFTPFSLLAQDLYGTEHLYIYTRQSGRNKILNIKISCKIKYKVNLFYKESPVYTRWIKFNVVTFYCLSLCSYPDIYQSLWKCRRAKQTSIRKKME